MKRAGFPALLYIECGMIGDIALWHIGPEGQTLEIFRGHTRQFQPRIGLEAETTIIAGITQKNAAFSSSRTQLRKALTDQLAADPSPCRSGRTETGPSPYQPLSSPPIRTGENAT